MDTDVARDRRSGGNDRQYLFLRGFMGDRISDGAFLGDLRPATWRTFDRVAV